jgi:quercetin dioxygenase-like cupin family protein
MSAFAHLSDIGPQAIWDGVQARTVEGARITMAVVELAAGRSVPEHRHHNEQLGLVLKGSLIFRIGDERRELVAGDTYNIPAEVPHDVVAGSDGAVVLDVFSPVRADWGKFTPGPPLPPLWP